MVDRNFGMVGAVTESWIAVVNIGTIRQGAAEDGMSVIVNSPCHNTAHENCEATSFIGKMDTCTDVGVGWNDCGHMSPEFEG